MKNTQKIISFLRITSALFMLALIIWISNNDELNKTLHNLWLGG